MDDNEVIISSKHPGRSKYHTEECTVVETLKEHGNIREVPQSQVDRMNLEKCAYCSGEYEQHGTSVSPHLESLKQAAENND